MEIEKGSEVAKSWGAGREEGTQGILGQKNFSKGDYNGGYRTLQVRPTERCNTKSEP